MSSPSVIHQSRGRRADASVRAARVTTLLGALCVLGSACASPRGGWFQLGPRPSELAGVWVDSSKASPTDTVAWVLAANGEDRTLHIHVARDSAGREVVRRDETRYGWWYLAGQLGDTAAQRICSKRRPRDGGSCYRFRLDTLPVTTSGAQPHRVLRILGFRGAHHTRDRVLLERR